MAEYCDCKECGYPITVEVSKNRPGNKMADYSDYPGGKNYEPLGDRIGRRYMEHAGTKDDAPEPTKTDEKPEKWNTEWDQAYELGLKHGAEREREKLAEKVQRFLDSI